MIFFVWGLKQLSYLPSMDPRIPTSKRKEEKIISCVFLFGNEDMDFVLLSRYLGGQEVCLRGYNKEFLRL